MLYKVKSITVLIFFLSLISACTYNPFSEQNRLTGDVAGLAVGAGAGAGTMALIGAPRPLIFLGGIGGGALGYYVTTLNYDAAGVTSVGGEVYQVGNYLTIEIPTDYVFEENTTRFISTAPPILDSAVTVLKRYPERSILVAGNTSGFDRERRETALSRARARVVVQYLNEQGINAFQGPSIELRKIRYVGHGDKHPIRHHYTNDAIRANSNIIITAMLTKEQLTGKGSGQDCTFYKDGDYSHRGTC
jgi:outer membrane protein OmpA-like peptidoglycan-associated protein